MIGIYKYTNKINGKIYIGLSNDIQRRKHEHQSLANRGDRMYIHQAIKRYGIENFDFEVIEVFEKEDRVLMGEREQYWIEHYNSYKNGYNETIGGDIRQGRSKLTKQDVIDIRTRYANLERCMVVYQDYKDRIGRSGFNKIWKGETWKNIMPEIYTPERRFYHATHTGNSGEYNGRAKLTKEQVIAIRTRYTQGESPSSIYQDYSGIVTFGHFQQIALGYEWNDVDLS